MQAASVMTHSAVRVLKKSPNNTLIRFMKPSSPALKALVHGALAVVSAAEALHSKDTLRRFILGLATGWHLYATAFHIFYDDEKY